MLGGSRVGPREYIHETKTLLGNNLILKTNCLVTRVLFQGTTAIGVEYVEGDRACTAPIRTPPRPRPDRRH